MPAAGKSTMGKCLATQLKYQFIDLDQEIEKKVGKTIAQLFEEGGEAQFRSIERETLLENLQLQDTVLATGGGTPCFGDGMRKMQMAGKVVYLKSSIDNLLLRLEPSIEKRPILASKPVDERRQFIIEHLAQREKFYAQADITVIVDGKTVSEIADEIIAQASK